MFRDFVFRLSKEAVNQVLKIAIRPLLPNLRLLYDDMRPATWHTRRSTKYEPMAPRSSRMACGGTPCHCTIGTIVKQILVFLTSSSADQQDTARMIRKFVPAFQYHSNNTASLSGKSTES